MNFVPVADQGKDKEHDRDEQESSGLRGINRVPLMPVCGWIVADWGSHGPILALEILNLSSVFSVSRIS